MKSNKEEITIKRCITFLKNRGYFVFSVIKEYQKEELDFLKKIKLNENSIFSDIDRTQKLIKNRIKKIEKELN